MKKYIIPSLTVENFETQDVITASMIISQEGDGMSASWDEI